MKEQVARTLVNPLSARMGPRGDPDTDAGPAQSAILFNSSEPGVSIANWGAGQSLSGDLTMNGTGTRGGHLHVQGIWHAPGPVGNFKVSGMLGRDDVAVLVPEA